MRDDSGWMLGGFCLLAMIFVQIGAMVQMPSRGFFDWIILGCMVLLAIVWLGERRENTELE